MTTTSTAAQPASAPPTERAATSRAVPALLRAEGSVALTMSLIAYRATGGSWWMFVGLFLLPDLSMLGYLKNARVGAACYNTGHTYLVPAAVALAGAATASASLIAIAIIWVGHIGFDRAMGYGLKYPSAFGATHLGWKGKVGRVAAR